MARGILWLARVLDTEGWHLQQRGGWRWRLGSWLERLAFSAPVRWAWGREYSCRRQ